MIGIEVVALRFGGEATVKDEHVKVTHGARRVIFEGAEDDREVIILNARLNANGFQVFDEEFFSELQRIESGIPLQFQREAGAVFCIHRALRNTDAIIAHDPTSFIQ